MTEQEYLPEHIKGMSYVDFISLLKETNRCPGGKNTIRKIIQNTFIGPQSNVLEIGSNTGFTSLEIARVAKCRATGIEPVPAAVQTALAELQADTPEIQKLVKFEVASAYEIPYGENEFDVVVTGGATSFMADKEKALTEYHRVLKPWGFLSVTNLCYLVPPPTNVVAAVSNIIGVQIPVWTDRDWLALFRKNKIFEQYYLETHKLQEKSDSEIAEYVQFFIDKPHIAKMPQETREEIRKRWTETLMAFNENHKYLGFILAVFRKRAIEEEPELFTHA